MKLEVRKNEKLSVLVVDDEGDIRETLCTFLEMMEIFDFIVQAKDGSDATRRCQNQQFDLIITDLIMPNVRGLEFIQNLKHQEKRQKIEKPTPIIILSANLTGDEVKKAIEMGIRYVIAKPCRAEEFINKVTEVLSKYKRDKVKIVKDEDEDDDESD